MVACVFPGLWLTRHVKDAVAGADVGEEGVSQTLAGVSALHQAGDIHDIKKRRDLAIKPNEQRASSCCVIMGGGGGWGRRR